MDRMTTFLLAVPFLLGGALLGTAFGKGGQHLIGRAALEFTKYKARSSGEHLGWVARSRVRARPGHDGVARTMFARLLGPGELVEPAGGVGSVAWRTKKGGDVVIGHVGEHGDFKVDLGPTKDLLDSWVVRRAFGKVSTRDRLVNDAFWSMKNNDPSDAMATNERFALLYGPGRLVAGKGKARSSVFWRTLDDKKVRLGEMVVGEAGERTFVISPFAERVRNRFLGEHLRRFVGLFNPNDYAVTGSTSRARLEITSGDDWATIPYESSRRVKEARGRGPYVLDLMGRDRGGIPAAVVGVLMPNVSNMEGGEKLFHPVTFGFRQYRATNDPSLHFPDGMYLQHTLTLWKGDVGPDQVIDHHARLMNADGTAAVPPVE